MDAFDLPSPARNSERKGRRFAPSRPSSLHARKESNPRRGAARKKTWMSNKKSLGPGFRRDGEGAASSPHLPSAVALGFASPQAGADAGEIYRNHSLRMHHP